MEYAVAVCKNKPTFHINFIMDVSPNCDCWHYNDIAIVPNIGIAASFNPVALDCASADMVNKSPIVKNSTIGQHSHEHKDRFNLVFPNIDWRVGINYAELIGLGEQKFEIIEVN